MRIQHFRQLAPEKQCCVTWQRGVLLLHRSAGNTYMCLYRVGNFYVELQYNTCYDGVAAIYVCESEDALSAYLDQISLDDLLAFC